VGFSSKPAIKYYKTALEILLSNYIFAKILNFFLFKIKNIIFMYFKQKKYLEKYLISSQINTKNRKSCGG
jgi:hypothetical protein